jgi:plastocyanin
MRLRGKVAAITAAAMLLTAPAAIADEEIVGATPNRYQNADVTIDQGEKLTFRNTDFVMHDVVSDAKGDVKDHLFASDTISGGSTSFVGGSQYLTTGTYTFYCSVHPSQMKGTLTVTSAGTPAQRPSSGSGDSAPAEPLLASVAKRAAKASDLRRGKRLKAEIGTNKAATVDFYVLLHGRKAAHMREIFSTGGSRRVAVVLKKSIRRKLHRGTRLELQVNAQQGATGSEATASLKLG